MGLSRFLYTLGVLSLALAGFCSPLPYLGFIPAGAGLIWAAYDLTEVKVADPPPTPPPARS